MTKLKLFFMLSVLLGGLLLNTQPTAAQTAGSTPALFCSLATDKDKVRHKSGPEVANKVKELRKTNKRVNDALAAFERNEKKSTRRPDIDAATSVTFEIEKKSGTVALFRKASFTQGSMVPSGYVEIISIPTYSAPGEWQGTLIAYHYDFNGNFLDEYVADVMLLPDPTYTYWDAILEVSYTEDDAFIQQGTMALYDQMGITQGGWPATSRASVKPQFQKASFTQGWRGAPRFGIPATPRMKSALKCAGIGCAGAVISCGVGSIFFAGTPFAPCTTIGCTGSLSICTMVAIFGD